MPEGGPTTPSGESVCDRYDRLNRRSNEQPDLQVHPLDRPLHFLADRLDYDRLPAA